MCSRLDWIVYAVELPVNTIIGVYLRTKLQRKTNFPFYLFIYLERDTKVYRCIYQVSRLLNDVHIMITLHRIWFQKVFLLARYFFSILSQKVLNRLQNFLHIYIYIYLIFIINVSWRYNIYFSRKFKSSSWETPIIYIFKK